MMAFYKGRGKGFCFVLFEVGDSKHGINPSLQTGIRDGGRGSQRSGRTLLAL